MLFPKLALGLSGFETGVAVMPLIKGEIVDDAHQQHAQAAGHRGADHERVPDCHQRGDDAADPGGAFKDGGQANGRALAYLAHQYLGNIFGSVYDISTILILAFAGASAMAGLLNLIPRYLPRFGMAPEWARASRPLVLVFMGIAFTVTLLFHANVDAQGGAYATGVLVLITSAAFAVTISVWDRGIRWAFLLMALVFVYTTVLNI